MLQDRSVCPTYMYSTQAEQLVASSAPSSIWLQNAAQLHWPPEQGCTERCSLQTAWAGAPSQQGQPASLPPCSDQSACHRSSGSASSKPSQRDRCTKILKPQLRNMAWLQSLEERVHIAAGAAKYKLLQSAVTLFKLLPTISNQGRSYLSLLNIKHYFFLIIFSYRHSKTVKRRTAENL